MEVTSKMTHEAVKQAVKDKILPTHSDMDIYIHHYESARRMIEDESARRMIKDESAKRMIKASLLVEGQEL